MVATKPIIKGALLYCNWKEQLRIGITMSCIHPSPFYNVLLSCQDTLGCVQGNVFYLFHFVFRCGYVVCFFQSFLFWKCCQYLLTTFEHNVKLRLPSNLRHCWNCDPSVCSVQTPLLISLSDINVWDENVLMLYIIGHQGLSLFCFRGRSEVGLMKDLQLVTRSSLLQFFGGNGNTHIIWLTQLLYEVLLHKGHFKNVFNIINGAEKYNTQYSFQRTDVTRELHFRSE